jgi:hypothetical protein
VQPLLQVPLAHTVPHARQLFGSVWRLTQAPLQSVRPEGQTHAVPLHTVVGALHTAQLAPHAFTSLATQAAAAAHWCCPAAHDPQTPLEHAPPAQAVAVPHWPAVVQVSRVLALAHWVAFGAQTPLHAPLTHAWSVQLTAAPHVPVAPQVSTAEVPEHCVAPGEQLPEHIPLTQA